MLAIVDCIWRKPVSTYAISVLHWLASVNSVKSLAANLFGVGSIRRKEERRHFKRRPRSDVHAIRYLLYYSYVLKTN